MADPPRGVEQRSVPGGPPRPFDPGRATLGELLADYAIFSTGAWHTWGGLDVDPVAEFAATCADPDCLLAVHDGPAPWCAGIARRPDEAVWDHRLWFVTRAHWPALLALLSGVAGVDRRRRRFFRTTVQVVQVVDRVAAARGRAGPGAPTAAVTCFGVDGTHHHVRFRPFPDRADYRTHTAMHPLNQETVRIARALFADDQDALRVFEDQ